MTIPFNRPWYAPDTAGYVYKALVSGKTSGDGPYTQSCHRYFEERYGFPKVLFTHSCTAALEMAALLLDIAPGDEVIVPSFTFVSTANAFLLRGAKIVLADSEAATPNIDPAHVEKLITPRTKAIVVVHYAGVACAMDELSALAKQHGIALVEDAALGLEATLGGRPLGSFGTFAAFSFHDTKNISSGEGGLLVINDTHFAERAEIIREKGTNRSQFLRGETARYTWVDIGSSYLPSDITAAVLSALLPHVEEIQQGRMDTWNFYHKQLSPLEQQGKIRLPHVPPGRTHNASLFYLACSSRTQRDALIEALRKEKIASAFHYLPLHQSPFYLQNNPAQSLPRAESWSESLLRLPLYYGLGKEEAAQVCEAVKKNL